MSKLLRVLAVASILLVACHNNHPDPDWGPPSATPAAPRPATSVRPTATGIPSREPCVTERPLTLWETKGPAFEDTVKCIEGLANRWWEEEEPALLWESSDPNWGGEQKLVIASDGRVGIGCCEGLFLPLQPLWHQKDTWHEIHARFALFQYEFEGEELTFRGKGDIASPAWERAILTWSRTVWAQLYTGHVCAACSTVLTWRHKEWNASEEADYCATLLVTEIGRVVVSSLTLCDKTEGAPSTPGPQQAWLSTDEWEQLDAWLNSRTATDFQDGQFWGWGGQQMSDDERWELLAWSESVYIRLRNESRSSSRGAAGAATPAGP